MSDKRKNVSRLGKETWWFDGKIDGKIGFTQDTWCRWILGFLLMICVLLLGITLISNRVGEQTAFQTLGQIIALNSTKLNCSKDCSKDFTIEDLKTRLSKLNCEFGMMELEKKFLGIQAKNEYLSTDPSKYCQNELLKEKYGYMEHFFKGIFKPKIENIRHITKESIEELDVEGYIEEMDMEGYVEEMDMEGVTDDDTLKRMNLAIKMLKILEIADSVLKDFDSLHKKLKGP